MPGLPIDAIEHHTGGSLARWAKELALIKARNTFGVFSPNAAISADANGSRLKLAWAAKGETAVLEADFADCSFRITIQNTDTDTVPFSFLQK